MIGNEALSLTFDASGALASMTNKAAGVTTPLTQVFAHHTGRLNPNPNLNSNPNPNPDPNSNLNLNPNSNPSPQPKRNSCQAFAYYRASVGDKASAGGGQESGGRGQASGPCTLRPNALGRICDYDYIGLQPRLRMVAGERRVHLPAQRLGIFPHRTGPHHARRRRRRRCRRVGGGRYCRARSDAEFRPVGLPTRAGHGGIAG